MNSCMRYAVPILLAVTLLMAGCSRARNAPMTASPANATAFVWKESKPQEQGVNVELLGQMEGDIKKNHTRMKSLLIVKNGSIVYEKYYHNTKPNEKSGIFSITKSIMSALTGIALDRKIFTGTDQTLADLLPDEFQKQTDGRKRSITLEHVLTMTGGLLPVDEAIDKWFASPDWAAYAIGRPLVLTPGSKFSYNTGLTHLLSAALTKATGESTKKFADDNLFGPMGITNYQWDQDSTGVYCGGSNLYMTPRDLAKFGILYLHQGKWQDRQLVPQEWVNASVQKKTEVDAGTGYGYLFWLTTMKDSQGKELFTYEANGYGGQHIRVVPELDSVIVVTSDYRSQEQSDANDLMRKYIVPALR